MKKHFFAMIMAFFMISAFSQTHQYNGVLKFTSRGSGPIYKNNSVEGYYTLYQKEKIDKKTVVYELAILDNNLKNSTSFQIIRPKDFYLLETVYNDEVFMFQFFDTDKKNLEFVTIDRNGKELGSHKIEDVAKAELARIYQAQLNEEVENESVWPLGNTGFLRTTFVKGKKIGFQLEGYSNSSKSLWVYSSPEESKLLETVDVLSTGENYVSLLVEKKKNKFAKKFDTFYVLLDAKTGKELYNFQMQDNNQEELSILNAFIDDKTGKSIVVGEYYAPGDEVMTSKSLGLYVREVEKDGTYGNFKKFGWDREIAQFKQENLEEEDQEKDKGTNRVWFHRIIRSGNGNIFFVGEQYRKQVSAMGSAVAAMGGNNSAFEIKMTNLVVFELNPDFDLVDYKLVPKKTRRLVLPQGYGMANAQVLGAYFKQYGYFDYQFTSSNTLEDNYDVVYSDGNRREEGSKEKSDVMIGVISIVNGKKQMERIPIQLTSKRTRFIPGKPGYFLVYEYLKKEKQIRMRLEKIST